MAQRDRTALLRLAEHPPLDNLVGFAVLVLPVTVALARNAVEVALPWGIGHAAAFLLADGAAAPGPAAIGLLVLSYVLPLVMLVGVLARGCQAPHDVFARTAVVPAR